MKVLHLDKNHPLLLSELEIMGFTNDLAYTDSRAEVLNKIASYTGVIVRSRITIDEEFLEAAKNLRFIGRVGAGLESIDTKLASKKNILLFSAPEGNRDSVAEHAMGMLLNLLHKLNLANKEVKTGFWNRESNRGTELGHKTVGLIGYGNMGKAFAKRLNGFGCTVICYDILPNMGDENAKQVSLEQLKIKADVLSLHTPWTEKTNQMVNTKFIEEFAKPFWFINTARGKSVITKDLVKAIKSEKILGAGLDVLEYEQCSFENLFTQTEKLPEDLHYLMQAENVILSPHIAGWTIESKEKLAQAIIDKIKNNLNSIKN